MVSAPQRLTTAQLRAMIGAGSKREDLPTKANGRSVISTRDSASKAHQAQLDKIARTKSFKERSASLTMKDARDIIAGTKPRITDTTNTYFRGDDRNSQISTYFYSPNTKPSVFIQGNKQTELREQLAKKEIEIKQKELQNKINYSGVGVGTSYMTPKVAPQKDTPTQNKNNQEINNKLLDMKFPNMDMLHLERTALAGILVGGIIIYFGVLKK
jgi:hypothetical protein